MPTDTTPKYPTTPTDGSAKKEPEKKLDLFHPEMPSIPGVSNVPVRPSVQSPAGALSEKTKRLALLGGIFVASVLVVIGFLGWIKHTLRAPVQPASAESSTAEPSVLPPLPSGTPVHEGPTIAATVEELSKSWAAKKFTFVRPLTQENVDAIVIRLPGGGLWAFALQEPYGKCNLAFVTDLDQIKATYGYRASHPMVVNPCSSTVYDPLKVGELGGNTWIRGQVVQGSGLRPPISIEVQTKGHSIIADRIE